ncbi:MAG: hypothetical protein ACPGVG_19110, partial [Mycobacterium sp.]
GSFWRRGHHGSRDTIVTGRDGDVFDELAVGVSVIYDETEDSWPRILLHIGSTIVDIDED